MSPTEWLKWFRDWLAKHPVKHPPAALQHGYVKEIMARIKALQAPSPLLQWFPKPRLGFALGMATACAIAFFALVNSRATRMAKQIGQELHLLSELGQLEEITSNDLEEEIQTTDQLTLAQALPEDDDTAWLERTVELLEQLGPDEPTPAIQDPDSYEDWLDELLWLDEEELASS